MPRFFISALQGDRAVVEGADAAHLARSLRVRPGEEVRVVDGDGLEHGIAVEEVGGGRVAGRVTWTRPATGEPRLCVHVLQALPRDGMDEAVEAMCEVGAAAIHPVVTDRCTARPDAARSAARVRRWRTIALQAAQLAGRVRPPHIFDVASLDDALTALPAGAGVVALTLDAPVALRSVEVAAESVALVVGPEGGLSPAERERLAAAGAVAAHLGARTLRARLAGSVAVALLLQQAGDLDTPVDLAPA